MPFQIIRNDITKVKADAIVNTANPEPIYGSGTDSAIYKAAGERQLLAARKKIGEIAPGQAAWTIAFRLDARYIIHTVGPAWAGGHQGEREILHACYANSLALAAKLSCESIAFPLIATGVYGFPKDRALEIALFEINRFLLTHDMEVILVVFDKKAFTLSGKLVGEIEEYIDEHAVGDIEDIEYEGDAVLERRRRNIEPRKAFRDAAAKKAPGFPRDLALDELCPSAQKADFEDFTENIPVYGSTFSGSGESAAPIAAPFPDAKGKSLDDLLENTGETFQEKLFELIDERGLDDVTVYKRANIDRKVFSKIRCKPDYKPKKKTAVAFAIALKLDMPTMVDLLSRAEIAFSPSNKFDLIISYFVSNQMYDIFEINAALFEYGQPTLG